jgi:hypothetical protein
MGLGNRGGEIDVMGWDNSWLFYLGTRKVR